VPQFDEASGELRVIDEPAARAFVYTASAGVRVPIRFPASSRTQLWMQEACCIEKKGHPNVGVIFSGERETPLMGAMQYDLVRSQK